MSLRELFGEHCPFCQHDPYEYVHVGIGWVPVAVTCCQFGILLFDARNDKDRDIATRVAESVHDIEDLDARFAKAEELFQAAFPMEK